MSAGWDPASDPDWSKCTCGAGAFQIHRRWCALVNRPTIVFEGLEGGPMPVMDDYARQVIKKRALDALGVLTTRDLMVRISKEARRAMTPEQGRTIGQILLESAWTVRIEGLDIDVGEDGNLTYTMKRPADEGSLEGTIHPDGEST